MTRRDTKKANVRARRFANRPYNGLILHAFPFPLRHSYEEKNCPREWSLLGCFDVQPCEQILCFFLVLFVLFGVFPSSGDTFL